MRVFDAYIYIYIYVSTFFPSDASSISYILLLRARRTRFTHIRAKRINLDRTNGTKRPCSHSNTVRYPFFFIAFFLLFFTLFFRLFFFPDLFNRPTTRYHYLRVHLHTYVRASVHHYGIYRRLRRRRCQLNGREICDVRFARPTVEPVE